MSEESALEFRKLVSAMRTTEKEYWRTRRKDLLKKSIELEKRVDDIVKKANGSDVPQNDKGAFFLEVATLRANTKLYFHEKKQVNPDKDKVKSYFSSIKSSEAKIDKMLIRFQDEEIKEKGYSIEFHVMMRTPRANEAHSIYNSMDEQLAKIELNDYLRHPDPPGTMYYLCKKYVNKNGKPISDEEINNIKSNN